jgi:hypothetical protein
VGADRTARRRAWAAAHWAVASADAYDVVRVQVEDRVWDRTAPGDGWTRAGADAARPGVTISVAGAATG